MMSDRTQQSEDAIGTLPSSDALAEADAASLSELMSRDPERFSEVDLSKLIEVYRAQRERHQQAEASGAKPRERKTVAERAKSLVMNENAMKDLGL